MDALLEEKLSLDEFWLAYVGDISPLEFMNRMTSPEIDASVEAYVATLPDLFGIVRRQSWKLSFEAPIQFRRGEVASALREKLEKTEAEWRPHLNQRPPEPVQEYQPIAEPQAEQHAEPEADQQPEAAFQHVSDPEPSAAPSANADEPPAPLQNTEVPPAVESSIEQEPHE